MEGRKIKNDHYTEVLFLYLVVITLVYLLNVFNTKGDEVIFLNRLHNKPLDFFFALITELGNGIFFLPIIFLVSLKGYRFAFFGASVWAAHGLICLVLKRFLFSGFKRPAAILDHSLLHFVDGVTVHHHYSFPSGHTATIFCLAVFISLTYKNRWLTFGLMCLAVAVGCSRIYLLQHFLEDVLAGAIVGALTSFAFYAYFMSAKFPPWMNSNLSTIFRPRLSRRTQGN
jgi:membrane-associated phospholipid phosphatase